MNACKENIPWGKSHSRRARDDYQHFLSRTRTTSINRKWERVLWKHPPRLWDGRRENQLLRISLHSIGWQKTMVQMYLQEIDHRFLIFLTIKLQRLGHILKIMKTVKQSITLLNNARVGVWETPYALITPSFELPSKWANTMLSTLNEHAVSVQIGSNLLQAGQVAE